MNNEKLKEFNPLLFLSSLGAGGISVAFFAFLNYTIGAGKGMINVAQIHDGIIFSAHPLFLGLMEFGMIVFALIHIILTIQLAIKIIPWLKTQNFRDMLNDPLSNSALVTPFISVVMTMNVFLSSIRYFIPSVATHLQTMMMPGLVFWIFIWVALMFTEIKLLKISFVRGFDVNKINFGWLLHPFALAMLTVTGSGIAALAKDATIAHTAFFMLLISGTMGLFLLLVKTISIFKSHFSANGLPDKQFLPSFLIVIPNITLFAIAFFRIGHYLEHHHGAHLHNYFMIIMITALAFETWYMMFGLALLRDYFKKYFFDEFNVSQWGLICPFVAYSVLSAFTYSIFFKNIFFYFLSLTALSIAVILFFMLLYKQLACQRNKKINIKCE